MERKFDHDDRLINFAAAVISIAEKLPKSLAADHLASQLVRSCTRRRSTMARRKVQNHEMTSSTNENFGKRTENPLTA